MPTSKMMAAKPELLTIRLRYRDLCRFANDAGDARPGRFHHIDLPFGASLANPSCHVHAGSHKRQQWNETLKLKASSDAG
jgi:hypothetical protein